MDKRWKVPVGLVLILVTVVGILLPGLLGSVLIAEVGIALAKALFFGAYAVSTICFIASVLVLWSPASRYIMALLAKLAPKQEFGLPAANEANSDVIVLALQRVGEKYPNAKPGINECLEQARMIEEQLDYLSRILAANSGITAFMAEVPNDGEHENLVYTLLASTYRGLIPIIYAADNPEVNRSTDKLLQTISEVNAANAVMVTGTQEVIQALSDALTKRDDPKLIAKMVDEAIVKLNSKPERKELT